MDVHLHARFVNLHIVSSARRLTHQELATTEAHAEHRYQEAQFLLYHWTGWLSRVEAEQCRILLTYKETARALRSKTEALLGGGGGAGSQFSSHPPWSSSSSTLGTNPGGFNTSTSSETFVPRHCRLTPTEREAELRLQRKLDPPHCPVHVITPKLFQGYNASEYFAAVVAQSRGWLSAVQEWVSVFLTCLFAFVATICLWNALGDVLWFFALRFNIINRKHRKQWPKPQPLRFSFSNGQSSDCCVGNDHSPATPTVSCNFRPQNLITVADNLILAPFSKRAIIDFGDSLTFGKPCTRYLRLMNPRNSSIKVQCKRYPTSDEFALHWLLTSQDVLENLSDPKNEALIDPESPVTNLVTTPSLELAHHAECLLRIVWTPKPPPFPSLLDAKVTSMQAHFSNLRHTLQFTLGGGGLIVEANIVASTIKQPIPRRPRASWALCEENQKRQPRASSSGLRILAAHLASKEKRLSQSLDRLHLDSSLLDEEVEFQTPKKSISTANDLNRSPGDEIATAFITPALLSPVVKQGSNVLYTANKTTSAKVPENVFGWDASAALSEANELGFTRWLNHLFTSGHATRSTISKSSHQDDPEKDLLDLLQTPNFSAPGHRIEREIDSGKLVVNNDLNFKLDKGLQLRTVELFTSHYSPIWLTPCVDVLSKFVHLPEDQLKLPAKSTAMTKRVYRYLFADVSPLKTKSSQSSGKHLSKTWQNQVTEHYNRQIVKRCLTLIWLLDQAKLRKIRRFDPCLFNLSAPAKSSTAVCLTLGRNYLTRESNLPRSLSNLGANLSVIQTPLDEFDYTVTNLAIDLRDGLRLVKLADLLLVDSPSIFPSHNNSLISLVRFPAISRLQKIHNVRLALSAFEKIVGQKHLYTAAGKPISERDIVDGHRSKTLSLLWFILLRFQVTALLNPPALRGEISRLIDSTRTTSANKVLLMSLRREVDTLLSNSSAFGVDTHDPLVEMENNQRILFLWVRAVMSAGGYSNVNVENFDQSFGDGRIFCYILHYYLPILLPKRLVRIVTTQTAKSFPGIPLNFLLRNNSFNLQLFQQRVGHSTLVWNITAHLYLSGWLNGRTGGSEDYDLLLEISLEGIS
ncbi:unnamed protein product [Rodentolepis nana]|uniref:Calponin-homology (CH) domain-containing protein n=1 Tax=Rodentolepis nana TaxID=102285 RepID=A0A0R3TY65_RODNA|nr:unnamed protein product [Rodentolepis nana]